ncbi:DUF2460 domain-containing protein (plasmid) [Bradyrhizobium elkanii]|jgi:uncharacterized protein (TIGR02217 family)|uniref:DUF2460 domain-containing protein n=1 Tax=Bradyrhizobium elkanii TaxID=29448 RepID=UPI0027155D8F|nr:DUF2460 domain-containing protein [Bradyrhizobium elkanii]WLB14834.1 DUF2460 domain-containing protein [Bradyrhizobium elkanii]WLB69074.1 DUF2460 domain-containing protein [Bradyrhizobium elkanii]
MVDSTITIIPIYLDGREALSGGGVSTIEDDTVIHKSDSRTVSTTERSDRVQRSWQLTWNFEASEFIVKLFMICRNSKGFLFISPMDEERIATGQLLRNTVTGLNVGDGSTKTFQLQFAVSLSYDIGIGSASTDLSDVNYPIDGTVVAYKNGIAASLSGVDLISGIVTFDSAPGNGVVPTADYERAIPVMFTSSSIGRTLIQTDYTEVRSVQIEEIF